ncbi:MAG: 50S ribosomal protein L34 [Planctomycetota bacterium]
MKVRIRKSAGKRVKKTGFRARSKTHGGRNIIKRKRRRSGGFRVG